MANILIQEEAVSKAPAAFSALQSNLFQMAEDHRRGAAAVGCSQSLSFCLFEKLWEREAAPQDLCVTPVPTSRRQLCVCLPMSWQCTDGLTEFTAFWLILSTLGIFRIL